MTMGRPVMLERHEGVRTNVWLNKNQRVDLATMPMYIQN